MTNRFIVALLVGMMTLAGAAVASAGSITFTTNWTDVYVYAAWGSGDPFVTTADSYTVTVTDATGMGPLALNQTFETFCVDLAHAPSYLESSSSSYQAISQWDLNAPSPHNAEAAWILNHFFANGPGVYGRAAYQIAIWEALYETDLTLNITDGTATFTLDEWDSATGANANILLSLAQPGSDAGWLRNFDSEGDTQDFGAPTPVPDGGGTLVLLGGALMGLDALRRKIRR